jgi:oligoendopeptidase F
MFDTLPENIKDVMDWKWDQYAPYVRDLQDRPLNAGTVNQWLADWSRLDNLLSETSARLYDARTLNTTDEAINKRFMDYLEQVIEPAEPAMQALKQKLLASGLEPEDFAVPLRNMRSEADLFREENVPLDTEHTRLASGYDQIIGGQMVEWEGISYTLAGLVPVVENAGRATREKAWRLASERVLQDREAINQNWRELVAVRRKIAANAGKADYREYAWQARQRFDYTPADCETFHRAIEKVIVPAAERVYQRRAQQMGLDVLRPWDVGVDVMRNTDLTGDPLKRDPIVPFKTIEELEEKASGIFQKLDPELNGYFQTMRREKLLDLANYQGKAPGAYCQPYPASKRAFVMMNAVGSTGDVDTLFHEMGHAFNDFEMGVQPYAQQHNIPMEFAEVASMSMEHLASPYLHKDRGGFYSAQEYARARTQHLEKMLIFWPFMAVMDAFQHIMYTTEDAADTAACDRVWGDLWDRFMKGVDWSGLEDQKVTGWHRKVHLRVYPFYYVEYGLAQLGAAQVWRNSMQNEKEAVAAYRQALSLGGSVTLPELYQAAGARFGFDAELAQMVVDLIEGEINELSQSL